MNTLGHRQGNDGSGSDGVRESPHQPQQQSSATLDQSGMLYDFSSFDPLQAHAFQLTASAGLSNLMANSPSAGLGNSDTALKPQPQQPLHQQQASKSQREQQQIQQPAQFSLQTHQIQQPQSPYFYIPPSNTAATTLHSIAPAATQTVASAIASQAPIVGQGPQNFLLPATAQGTALAGMSGNFQAPIFPNTLATTSASPAMIPSLLMTQHFQPQQLIPSAASKKRDTQDMLFSKQQPRKKNRVLEPSVVSSTTSTDSSGRGSKEAGLGQQTDQQEPEVDVANMTPGERRRHERNLREQQRSSKISQQIKELREVLTESNVPFKPNKYAILLSVVEYIKQLQSRAIMLDVEHQKLITTIRETNEMVNSGNLPSSADETYATNLTGNSSSSDQGSDSEMLFVQGLNYKSAFEQCPAALSIAALDGRILECNSEFQLLLGFTREDLMKQSLFNLVKNHQDIFRAMAEMLKAAEEEPLTLGGDSLSSPASKNQVWTGAVISKRDTKLSMNLTLTFGNEGTPKYFSCSVTLA